MKVPFLELKPAHEELRTELDVNQSVRTLSRLTQLKYYMLGEISDALYTRRCENFEPTSSSDAVVLGIQDCAASIARCLEAGDLEKFLKRVTELSDKLLLGSLKGRALFVPELDELVRRASSVITPDANPSANPKLLVHVATEVYPTGGHTRVIEDIVAVLPEYRHVLITTLIDTSHPNLKVLKPRFDKLGLNVHPLRTSGRAERARELSSLVGAFAPQAVLLLVHPYDGVAYAGVGGNAAPRVIFMHHADHWPSLGASRTDYVHVDLTPACHKLCASHPNLHASLLNLTVKDTGIVAPVNRQHIIGVTCGSARKYAGVAEFTYGQLLAGLFSSGVARVFHIGGMSGSQKDQICADIVASGQDANKVVFLPDTSSLAGKLVEIAPDFYLTSHPMGSGKATVEALSVGLPVLFVCPASTSPLLNPDMTLNASVPVSTLEGIPAAVRRLEREKKVLAKRSRQIYEEHYSASSFREGLLSAINSDC